MNRRNQISETSGPAAWVRRAADVAAILGLGLGLAIGVFAQSPTGTSPSGTNPTSDPARYYSWPGFHAGGTTPNFVTPTTPLPGEPLIPYGQLQGTPTGLYTIPGTATAGTFTQAAGTAVTTQIPSRLLGNYLPSAPPADFVTPGVSSSGLGYFPNHFRDGGTPPYLQIVGPFGYTYPTAPTGTYPQVQSSPAAVNVTEFPDLTSASYYGVQASATIGEYTTPTSAGAVSAPDTTKFGANSTDPVHQIRQVVYFGRTEIVPVIATANGNEAGGIAVPNTVQARTNLTVGAIYAMDGFTGGIIWRYQVPSFRTTSTGTVQTPFAANLSGTINAAQSSTTPQPFQIGPTVGNIGVAGQTTLTPGTLNVTSAANLGGLPSAALQFTLYASSATVLSGGTNQVAYNGTYAIYPAPTTGTPVPVSEGYFTATATYTAAGGTTANVTGTFTATSGAAGYSGATFTGTLDGAALTLSGTLAQTTSSALTLGTPQVYSSPVVTRMEVTPPGGGTPTLKTVVVIADNNGFVYCLDAVGDGDGSSNSNIYLPASGIPVTDSVTGQAEIGYDAATSLALVGARTDPSGNQAHVGTTFPYWVYRPDATQPKYVSPATGITVGTVKPVTAFNPNSDLPVPAAFGTASANVYVNPTTNIGTVYVGNSNGVLYAFDGTGVSSSAATTTTAAPSSDPYNNPLTGLPGVADATNTPLPLWWFSTGGVSPNANPTTSITSAPTVYLDPNNGFNPVVYVGTSSSLGNNTGRIYAVDGINGPRGNNGETDPTITTSTSPTYGIPGSPDYNFGQRPYWAFPDQYGNDYVGRLTATSTPARPAGYESWSTNGSLRPSVGDITGSPVLFNNPHDGSTRLYFAANAGSEVRTEGSGANVTTATFPANQDEEFGRLWGINTNGSATVAMGNTGTEGATPTWVYPEANNPNDAAEDGATEPSQPLGGFRNATPAMGIVEFPKTILEGTGTAWSHPDHGGTGGAARTLTFNGTVSNQQVAMLYVGTYTPNDAAFYEVDVDGTSDTERNIYRLVSPNGAGFQSSPALVTNSSTAGGNGGAVYISAANTLFQLQATPISNPSPGQAYPFIAANGDQELSGAGPISSPAIAAADVTNLPGTNGVQNSDTVRDWVYIADDTLSLCRGFTPDQQSNGQDESYLPIPLIPSQVESTNVGGQYPLRAFVFDGTPVTHPGTSADMTLANPITGTLPVFEWGGSAYIRIANVVPPVGAIDDTSPQSSEFPFVAGSTTDHQALVIDPNDPNTAYGNGGSVTFQLEDSSSKAIGATLQVPAVAPVVTVGTIKPDQNGFYRRADHGTVAETTPPGNGVALVDSDDAVTTAPTLPVGFGWVAAYTYHIAFNDGTLLSNTPGSQRHIINASQNVTVYKLDATTGMFAPATPQQTLVNTMPTGDFLPNNSQNISPTSNTGSLGEAVVIDQPTFGILNPLAVRGGGLPLGSQTGAAPQPLGGFAAGGNLVDGIGPFRTVSTALTPYDLQALANGNLVYTLTAPRNGSTTASTDPTQATATLNTQATGFPQAILNVATSTPQILDGSQGDNTNPAGLNTVPPVGSYSTGNGITATGTPSTNFGPATLNIADRSLLGLQGQVLQISIQPASIQWNDNAILSGGTATDGLGNGAAAVINHMPWEDTPTAYSFGSNSSTDYPSIPQQDLTNTFVGGPLDGQGTTNTSLIPETGATTASPQAQQITPSAVRVQVNVPKYQPANLQLYKVAGAVGAQTQTPTSPLNTNTRNDLESATGPTNSYFPMGYVATEKITAATNGSQNPNDPNVAYRDVQVYTGVPVDIKTSITNPITDVGNEPAGFGTQMAALNPGTGAIGPFTPYNPYAGYRGHFQPLSIVSDSNVNLINPHLDQKVAATNLPNGQVGQAPGLPLLADALDSGLVSPYSYIPGYDFAAVSDLLAAGPDANTYVLNGANTATALRNSILPQPYLIRSTLDTDVAEAFGRNPVLAAQDTTGIYPVVTFHKPRVGDGNGTSMTVPDLPHDNTGLYAVTSSPGATPALSTVGIPSYATKPYVGVAVPFGTPVGTYSQNLRLFEGYDTPYYPFVGPTYGQTNTNLGIGGQNPFDPSANGLDTFQLNYANGATPHAAQSYSDPATQIKVTVGEERLTDGFTAGALPMIDTGSTVTAQAGAANFAPFGLNLPYPGGLGLYWSSSRDYTTPGVANTQYRLQGAQLGVTANNALPTYVAATAQQWWSPLGTTFDLPGQPNGNNVAFGVAQTQASFGTGYGLTSSGSTLYGFGTNVMANGPLAVTTLYCTPMTSLTPSGSSTVITASSQPKTDQHGLSFTGVSFQDPNSTTGGTISNNLWSFWTGGTRGRTALYYSSALTSSASGLAFTSPAVLPVPAGLVAVNDPNPVLTNAPDLANTTGAPVPAIEVTYSGTGASGSPDLYLSRYRPYTSATTPAQVALGLMPFPAQTEQLQPDTANLATNSWWQARDVGWVRNNALSFSVTVTLANAQTATTTFTETAPNTYTGGYSLNGAQPTAFSGNIVYDRASGILTLTNVTLPLANGSAFAPTTGATGQTVFVDVAQGRVRFSVRLPYGSPNTGAYSTVLANFSATARRITTSSAANTQPVAFLDEAYQPNSSGVATDQNVQADRYWYVWRKSGVGGSNPTLWFKTQRLTVALTGANGQPIAVNPASLTVQLLNAAGNPTATLYNGTTPPSTGNVVDVDKTRGRLYFPITFASANGAGSNSETALEGQTVRISGNEPNGTALPTTGIIEWQDEPLYNDPAGQDASGTLEAAASDGYAIPLLTTINESGASAFLDAGAFENTTNNTPGNVNPASFSTPANVTGAVYPHKVWLFWTSNRNGAADIYSEAINPRFTAAGDTGTP